MVLSTFRIEKTSDKDRSGSGPARPDRETDHLLPSADGDDYSRQNVLDITKGRCGWLLTFCIGLLVSAIIVQRFEDLLEHHVQLSFFVPLVMGHGGNTGSQAVSTIIRALALRQISQRDMLRTVVKESVAGALMGGVIGACIILVSMVWPDLGLKVGLTVGVALPIISMWANLVGAVLTLLADRFKLDPAVTSVPLMTTIVDATGLIIYFYIGELFLDVSSHAAVAHAATGVAAAVAPAAAAAATKAATAAGSKGVAAATAAAAAGSGAAAQAGKAVKDALRKILSPPPPLGGRGRGGVKGKGA
ncbi:hypothetical protein HYH03_004600 [Edaphochlamys debaryana]|uniref:SLC41A/MgtE integral membrane domain-containing protein n=1 Tax=Edaphochlamys debaryana TaxID=47281 RepID=A0A835Y729_9CHLO|nr:hypothetical protein HYH03_004600 [Edaphochlamys debaryana]|eukprot:KAG2497445.1 hypothetical protein HYH03_004600 [Edaphochlamys debaryana]